MNFNSINSESVFSAIGHPSLILDTQHNVLATNNAAADYLKKSRDNLQGKKCYSLFHGTDSPPERCPMERMLTSGICETVEMEMGAVNGKFLVSCSPLFDDIGHLDRVLHIAADMSVQKQAIKSLEESEEKYRALVESSDDSIYLIDRNYRYLFINKKHLSRIGMSEGSFAQGLAFHEFHASRETETFIRNVDMVFNTGKPHQYEYLSQRDGRCFLQTFSPVKGKDGETTAITVISKDVTKMKQIEETLRSLSFNDELTGLYNRRGFITFARQQIKIASRLNKGALLLYANIDNLKQIKYEHGIQKGNKVVKEAANLFKEVFRESDIIAIIGDDAFVVFSIESTDNSIDMIKKRFQHHLDMFNAKTGRPYQLMINTGIACYEEGYSLSIEDLIASAEKAMHENKRDRRTS